MRHVQVCGPVQANGILCREPAIGLAALWDVEFKALDLAREAPVPPHAAAEVAGAKC
jgi:hypothetical protein